MKRMPRPLPFMMFSGASGSAMASGSKPVALVVDADRHVVGSAPTENSTMTRLARSFWLPCLMALTTDSRTATLTS